jgi:chloramphenicol O-acetyltransferase type A
MAERSFRVINLRDWPRAEHFYFFRSYKDPFFNLTANVDVTRLVAYCRDKGQSFFLSYMYYATACVNEIQEFRLRLLDGKLVEFPVVHSGSTILNKDNTFSFCYFDYIENQLRFFEEAKIALDKLRHQESLEPKTDHLDLIYCSTIPWVSFTSFKHAHSGRKEDSIPKLVFGKVFEQGGKKWMPVNVEVHHALMDGYHVGKFLKLFQQKINAL